MAFNLYFSKFYLLVQQIPSVYSVPSEVWGIWQGAKPEKNPSPHGISILVGEAENG